MSEPIELVDNNYCFVCSQSNPIGLHQEFVTEGNEYVTYFTPKPEHQGYTGIVHGGLVSTVIDEVMARYVWFLGYKAVTGELTIRFKKPMPIGQPIRFAGKIEHEEGRIIHCSANASANNIVYASATGKMVKVG